jgi:hypothetical protein
MSQIPGIPDHAAPDFDVVDASAVEPKTKAATVAGAGSAAIITPAVILFVDDLFYGGGPVDVPLPYVGVIGLVVTGVCTFAAGYFARHVNRAA